MPESTVGTAAGVTLEHEIHAGAGCLGRAGLRLEVGLEERALAAGAGPLENPFLLFGLGGSSCFTLLLLVGWRGIRRVRALAFLRIRKEEAESDRPVGIGVLAMIGNGLSELVRDLLRASEGLMERKVVNRVPLVEALAEIEVCRECDELGQNSLNVHDDGVHAMRVCLLGFKPEATISGVQKVEEGR